MASGYNIGLIIIIIRYAVLQNYTKWPEKQFELNL